MSRSPGARGSGSSRRPELTGAGLLSAATVGSGVLAYAFQVLAARSLGDHAFSAVAVLWGATFLVSIVLFRPLEQTVSRALADRLARGEEVGSVLRAGVRVYLGLVLVFACVLAPTWGVVTRHVFLGDPTLTVALAAGVVGYGAAYLVRGIAGGIRWFGGYGLALLADGAIRLVVALPLAFVASARIAAVAIAGAGAAGALPLVVGRSRVRALPRGGPARHFETRAAMAFGIPAAAIAGADQLLVNGAPLLVVLDGGSSARHAAGVVFAATMLVRIPVFVFQGVAASLLSNLTSLHAGRDGVPFFQGLRRAAATFLAVGVVIVGGCAAVGPEAMRLLFGAGFVGSRVDLTVLGAGVAVYLVAAGLSQGFLAADRGTRAAIGWTAAAVTFVGVYRAAPGAELSRVSVAFALAAAVAAIVLAAAAAWVFSRRAPRRADDAFAEAPRAARASAGAAAAGISAGAAERA